MTAKRPGNGMSPFDLDKILGKKVKEISKKISRLSYIEIFLVNSNEILGIILARSGSKEFP